MTKQDNQLVQRTIAALNNALGQIREMSERGQILKDDGYDITDEALLALKATVANTQSSVDFLTVLSKKEK